MRLFQERDFETILTSLTMLSITVFLFLLLEGTRLVNSHGRLMEPPNRSSLWRFPEFQDQHPLENYDDNQLYCGGAVVQHTQNGGKCGPCGDNYQDPVPRDNESTGKYGKGIITRRYSSGQAIPISVELTRSHLGYFEFHLCPQNNPNQPEVESCFGQYTLPLSDGSGTKLWIRTYDSGWFNTSACLPPSLTCTQCVLRWHYKAGNSWGDCGNGTSALGCGNQETFRGCSDIAIS